MVVGGSCKEMSIGRRKDGGCRVIVAAVVIEDGDDGGSSSGWSKYLRPRTVRHDLLSRIQNILIHSFKKVLYFRSKILILHLVSEMREYIHNRIHEC